MESQKLLSVSGMATAVEGDMLVKPLRRESWNHGHDTASGDYSPTGDVNISASADLGQRVGAAFHPTKMAPPTVSQQPRGTN
jgi:hypothetical protein